MVAGTERWTPSEHGAFLYMMGGAQCRGRAASISFASPEMLAALCAHALCALAPF